MKKMGARILIFIFPVLLSAQETAERFELGPEGFGQVVEMEYPGKTDTEIFEAVERWAEYMIANNEEALQEELNERYLQYRAFFPQGLRTSNDDTTIEWDVLLDIEFSITDQEIIYEIDIVEISSPEAGAFALEGDNTQWSFYDLQGQPREETKKAWEELNDIANNIIRGVSAFVNRHAIEE